MITRCAEPGCTETPSGGRHRNGGHACMRHTDPKSLLAPVRVGESPRAVAGMIGGDSGLMGKDEAGNVPEGAVDSWFRPLTPYPVRDHDEMRTAMHDGSTRYQQAPPVHVKGARYGSPREQKRKLREISEAEAERRSLAVSLAKVTAKSIANALRIPISAARRFVTERNKRA